MSSLQASEKEAAAVAKAPRVALADIEAAIAARYDTTADRAIIEQGVQSSCSTSSGSCQSASW